MYPSHPSLDEVYTLCPWKPSIGEVIEVNGGKYVIESAPVENRDIRVGKLIPNDLNIKNASSIFKEIWLNPHPNICKFRKTT